MNVLYAATRNLYPYLKGAIQSLLDHNNVTKLFVFAEDDELPFKIPCKHEVINVSNQTYFPPNNPNNRSIFTYMAMMRICAPEILKVNKVIWLDVDTIVCDSIEELWNTDMKGKWVAWCREWTGNYKPFGNAPYYNIGVCVLNLSQMRKDNVTQTAVAELNRQRYWCTDQDVMNLITPSDKMVDIPVRFNESFCCGYTDHPAVVHYAGIPNWYERTDMKRVEYLNKYRGG
jgi:lipopolysaccharide biosynthesis glycosyltransferase